MVVFLGGCFILKDIPSRHKRRQGVNRMSLGVMPCKELKWKLQQSRPRTGKKQFKDKFQSGLEHVFFSCEDGNKCPFSFFIVLNNLACFCWLFLERLEILCDVGDDFFVWHLPSNSFVGSDFMVSQIRYFRKELAG